VVASDGRRALRVLFLTQTYPRFAEDTSGPFIRDLAMGLVRGGDQVTVLTPHAEGVPDEWDDAGVAVRSFRYAPESWELLGYSRSLQSDENVRWGAAAVTPLYQLGARRAIRRELSAGSYDLLHAHWVIPNALVALPFAKRLPLAVGLHGSDVFLAEKQPARAMARRALRQASLLTGCSPELVERVCAVGFPTEASNVIPYGVDTVTFSPASGSEEHEAAGEWRRELGIPDAAVMGLGVGRMVTKKGFHVLIEALPELMRRHPEFHLVLAGAGDRLEEFRNATEAWRDRVHLPGIVYRDRLPDLNRAADFFVLPAVHDPKGNVDGLPNVILEAMASGLPIAASEITGIPLAVTDGDNGRLFPEQNPAALLEPLGELIADAEARRRMGHRSRERATGELTWDHVADRYRNAYHQMFARLAA